MLDARPKEPICLSWLYVTIASLAIFVTVPFARAIQNGIAERAESKFIVYLVAAIVAVVLVAIVRVLRQRQTSLTGYLWLLGVTVAYAAYVYNLRRNSIETIHFIEYGLLSLLVYRALVHRIRDVSIYPIAVLIVGIVGIVDEWIQWIAPSRFWDLRDVQINITAGALMQLAIGAGFRPALVSGRPSHRNLARLYVVTAAGLVLLGSSFANTPDRIAYYATRVPSLSFLMNSRSMMTEFGYLYDDPGIGIFRSRFTLDELEANDRNRGLELAAVLDKYINKEMYGVFHDIYTVPRDAWIHEAGVHLFRRNRYLEVADGQEERRHLHYNIAYRENQILEKYFPTGLHHSHHVWPDDLRKRVEGLAEKEPVYESRVSSGLITRTSEAQVLAGFGISVIALLLAAAFCYKRGRDEPNLDRR